MTACSSPPPLSDDQLSAMLDGVADAAVPAHLAHCAACAARLAHAHRTETFLRTQLHRFDCPTAHQLSDYHFGIITGTGERQIMRHVEQCALCRAEIEELRQFLAADNQIIAAPQPAPRTARPSVRQRLGEIVGRILPPNPAVALRGTDAGPIMAAAGNTTIILDAQPRADQRFDVLGQLVADDLDHWTGALVELRQTGAVITATVDDLGSFACTTPSTAAIDLRVTPEHGAALVLEEVALAS